MKNQYIIRTVLFLTIIFYSCEKDVLDKVPLDSVDENQVWSNPNLAQLYINDLYTSIPGGLEREVDDASDISEPGVSSLSANFYNTGSVSPSNSPFEVWDLYNPIRDVNTFLKNSDMLEGDQDLINTVKGEAIFLRAYFYAELVRFYGGVPLITEPQELTDNLSVSRNTYDECIEFISNEMDQAAQLLPLTWEDSNVGRATKGAALAVKARMLLYAASELNNPTQDMVKWQKASDAAKAVIDLGVYSLYPQYDSGLFLEDNNEEVIFDIQFGYPYRLSGYEYRSNPQGINGAFGMTRPTQEMIDMYEMANGKDINDPTSGYDPTHPYVGRDPRFYTSINYNDADWRGGKVETFLNGKNGPGEYDEYGTGSSMTGYYIRKFLDQTSVFGFMNDQGQTNWILIRYAEILLSYAEAQLELGNEDEARNYINMIRSRAGMPAINATGPELVDLLRHERTVELAFEEHRFFDVRRWKIGEETLNHPVHKMEIIKNEDGTFTYTVDVLENRVFTDKLYWAPIPQSEIQKNSNLEQNPGY